MGSGVVKCNVAYRMPLIGACQFESVMTWNWSEWGKRIWPISILILFVSLYSLYLQITANRPKLVLTSTTLSINKEGANVSMSWNNNGKISVHNGTVTLFTINENARRYETYGGKLIANGNLTTLVPIFGNGGAEIAVDMAKFLGVFFACTELYDDDNERYVQLFFFRPREGSPETPSRVLEEVSLATLLNIRDRRLIKRLCH
jgi:hypothetical protein